MIDSSAERNKRAMIVGAGSVAVILLFHFLISPWLDHWGEVRARLSAGEEKVALISSGTDRLLENVPVFKMPTGEDEQRLLFEREFNEQLSKAGIKTTGLPQYLSKGKLQRQLGVKLLRLQARGTGSFSAIMDLVATLNKNAYLVGIEALSIKCGKKKREEMDLVLTASTFAR